MAMTDSVHFGNVGGPLPGAQPEGYTGPKVLIPPIVVPWDLYRRPEAKKARTHMHFYGI